MVGWNWSEHSKAICFSNDFYFLHLVSVVELLIDFWEVGWIWGGLGERKSGVLGKMFEILSSFFVSMVIRGFKSEVVYGLGFLMISFWL